jgi:urease accessory protein
MLRFTRVADTASGVMPAGALRLRLTYDERSRSRLATITEDGTAAAITLSRGTVLRNGAVLDGDDGVIAIVEAAPQPLARISAGTALQLLRIVYHLANRHVPAQITEHAVLIECDPVLEKMAASLGAHVEHMQQPFEPEAGAYHDGGHAHSHGVEPDDPSRSIGEELSIAAHRARSGVPR